MPRGGAAARDGEAPPKRRPGGAGRPARFRDDSSENREEGRPARNFSGGRGPSRSTGNFSGGRGPARPARNFSGDKGPARFRGESSESRDEGRPARNFSGGKGPSRSTGSFSGGRGPSRSTGNFSGGRGAGSFERPGRFGPPRESFFDPTLFKAVIHRELPEATKQVKEIQELLAASAEKLLGLAEELGAAHDRLREKLAPGEAPELFADLETASRSLTGIFENMSFQDLAGQRLLKILDFLESLSAVAEKSSAGKSFSRRGDGDRKPRAFDKDRPGKKPRQAEAYSRLKGPQAAGGGMEQDEVNALLADL